MIDLDIVTGQEVEAVYKNKYRAFFFNNHPLDTHYCLINREVMDRIRYEYYENCLNVLSFSGLTEEEAVKHATNYYDCDDHGRGFVSYVIDRNSLWMRKKIKESKLETGYGVAIGNIAYRRNNDRHRGHYICSHIYRDSNGYLAERPFEANYQWKDKPLELLENANIHIII